MFCLRKSRVSFARKSVYLNADTHVLVTKPLADSETAARQLVDEAEDSGVVNMMSLGHRFGDACQHLGQLVKQGYFGELYYAKARSFRRNGIPIW